MKKIVTCPSLTSMPRAKKISTIARNKREKSSVNAFSNPYSHLYATRSKGNRKPAVTPEFEIRKTYENVPTALTCAIEPAFRIDPPPVDEESDSGYSDNESQMREALDGLEAKYHVLELSRSPVSYALNLTQNSK